MVDTEITGDVPVPSGDVGIEGILSVAVKTERGHTLTRDYGFTVEEEDGKVLAFDLLEHPDLGIALLFGQQVFALRFWNDEDLQKGLAIVTDAISKEVERRQESE